MMKFFRILGLVLVVVETAIAIPPNIILMMGDDHGWEETGYNGHPHVKTPVLDEMATVGLKFERFYAAHSNCSPTRASFLTGRHPNRMGTFAPGWSFRPEEITIPLVLGKAGYHCAHLGKWHLGAVKKESPVSPLSMGFHECLSHDNFFEINPTLSRNGELPQKLEGESSELLIREAIQVIERAHKANKPFFQVIWFGSPHEPYSGLQSDLSIYDELPKKYTKLVTLTSNETGNAIQRPQGEVLRERYAEITAMDRAIGLLRNHLKENGLRENTLLFYCGDNGTSPDAKLGFPHRGTKSTMYEGGILVPGLVEWPARIPNARTTQVRASTSDLLPTVVALTGQRLPQRPLDGTDLSTVFDGEMIARPSPLFFWESTIQNSAGARPYIAKELQQGTTPLLKKMAGKFTRDFTNYHHPVISATDSLGPRSIIHGDHKLVIHETTDGGQRIELFDLKSDPGEQNDLAAMRPEQVKQLQVQLEVWQNGVLQSLTGADYVLR